MYDLVTVQMAVDCSDRTQIAVGTPKAYFIWLPPIDL